MLLKLKSAVLSLSLLLGLAAPLQLVFAQNTYADTAASKTAACNGIGLAGGSCGGSGSQTNVMHLVSTIVQVLSAFVGVVAVVMIIIAGFKYTTSGGDSNSISSAKNTLIYAIVGLVIVALAQLIVHFVLNRV